jgi:hypothetical protein
MGERGDASAAATAGWRANTIDAGEGPGPVVAKIVERFRPEAIYGNATRRELFMVVNSTHRRRWQN